MPCSENQSRLAPALLGLTSKQQRAVRQFIECWHLSMPYHDIGSALNCGECNALHQLLVAFGDTVAAESLMAAHVSGDDEGDDPQHVNIKATQKTQT